jgi:hypothetical protein
LHVCSGLLNFFGDYAEDLGQEWNERFLEYLGSKPVYLYLLPPLLLLHVLRLLADHGEERVHPIIIRDLRRHEPLDFFDPGLHGVAVRELVQDREHLLAELKERVLGRQSA